jgi:hypothetical protein
MAYMISNFHDNNKLTPQKVEEKAKKRDESQRPPLLKDINWSQLGLRWPKPCLLFCIRYKGHTCQGFPQI